MPMRPSTDDEAVKAAGHDGLMITNLTAGQELSYQLYLPANSKEITLRYCGYSNSICEVLVDGVSQNYIDMPRNGSSTDWTEAKTSLSAQQGKHTVTLKLSS